MNELTTTNSIVPVKDIENEFWIYYYKFSSFGKYRSEPLFFFRPSLNYALQNQKDLFLRTGMNLSGLLNGWWESSLPERYWPTIEQIRIKKWLDPRKRSNLITNIKSKKKLFNSTGYPKYEFEEKKLNQTLDNLKETEVHIIKFKRVIISLMEQKKIKPLLVNFFKELTKKKGTDFDTYINDWVAKLKQESMQ